MSEELGWWIFGIAVAVLGIAISYAMQRKAHEPPKA